MARLQKRPPGSDPQTRRDFEFVRKKAVHGFHELKAAVHSRGNTRKQTQGQSPEQQRFSATRKLIHHLPFTKSNIIKGFKARFHRCTHNNNQDSSVEAGNGQSDIARLSTMSTVLTYSNADCHLFNSFPSASTVAEEPDEVSSRAREECGPHVPHKAYETCEVHDVHKAQKTHGEHELHEAYTPHDDPEPCGINQDHAVYQLHEGPESHGIVSGAVPDSSATKEIPGDPITTQDTKPATAPDPYHRTVHLPAKKRRCSSESKSSPKLEVQSKPSTASSATTRSVAGKQPELITGPEATDILEQIHGPLKEIPEEGIVALALSLRPSRDDDPPEGIHARLVLTTCGTNNRIYIIEYSDGSKVCLRVPASGLQVNKWSPDEADHLQSTALCMGYISGNTTLPMPKLIAYDTTKSNPIQAPYTMMTDIGGRSLDCLWWEKEGLLPLEERRENILKSLAKYMA
ncbi:MAG: hypothetical protein Q9165_003192 [Trypethelium subeluteriae]